MTTENGTKQLMITKEVGERWEVDFKGKISMRDMNQLRRLLPVAFTRFKRGRRIKAAQELREAKKEIEKPLPVKKLVKDRVTQFEINVAKSQKEILDGSV